MFVLKRPVTGTYFTIATKDNRSVLAFKNKKDAQTFQSFVRKHEDEVHASLSAAATEQNKNLLMRLLPKPKRNNNVEICRVETDYFIHSCAVNALGVAIYADGDVCKVEKKIDDMAIMFNLESLYYF